MICPHCGTDNSDSAPTCRNCGAVINAEQAKKKQQQEQPQPQQSTFPSMATSPSPVVAVKKSGAGKKILLAVIAFVLLIAIGSCIAGSGSSSKKKHYTTTASTGTTTTIPEAPELTRSDFNNDITVGSGSRKRSYSNYLDLLEQEQDTRWLIYWGAGSLQDDDESKEDAKTKTEKQKEMADSNRGINMSSSKEDVLEAYDGGNPVAFSGTSDHNKDFSDDMNQMDLPTSKVEYKYEKTGRTYYKIFYFDDEDKVCFVVWLCE